MFLDEEEINECFYKIIEENKKIAWDVELNIENFFKFEMKSSIDYVLSYMEKNKINMENMQILELGCGTGVISCYLAKKVLF